MKLRITYRSPTQLLPFPRNARSHSRRQIHKLAASISTFGFLMPVLVSTSDEVIAGHARIEAAKQLGWEHIPCICADHLTQEQQRAYRLADNRIAELAAWDSEVLADELKALNALDLDFSVELTGFDTAEIDLLIDDSERHQSRDPADDVPLAESGQPSVAQTGDLWLLGEHRLLCGDAQNPRDFDRLLAGQKAQLVFADPPYNVAIDGNATGLGRVRHREFPMASGEMSTPTYLNFLRTVCGNLVEASTDGSIHFMCMDWRHAKVLLLAADGIYSELKNICVWNKTNGGMGSFYRSKHEFVFVWKSGTAAHINNVDLGRSGRFRTNVWDYAGANGFGSDRSEQLEMHPTVKPVALVADALRDCSKRGGLILDPFVGSGTTLVAAERTGRVACGLELDPLYIDTAIRRWQTFTGKSAVHVDSGLEFANVEHIRRTDVNPTAHL